MRRNRLLTLLFCVFFFTLVHSQPLPVIHLRKILTNAPTLNPRALRLAVKGYRWALLHKYITNPNVLTIIDFNLPADSKRVWVINLKNSQLLMNLLTTQGKGSGLYYARHFSNQIGANQTSLGVYKTLDTYHGAHGLSERLQGLEKGVNDNAYRRAIVIHPAWYASTSFARRYHRTGRSWGCFAIDPHDIKRFIQLTQNGSALFAYATAEEADHQLT